MCCSSPTPPPAPDYAGAALAQGAANKETAITQGQINNPNVYTPYGAQTVTWGAGAPIFNQSGYDAALAKQQSDLNAWMISVDPANPNWESQPIAPTREQFTSQGVENQPTINQTLTPQSQQIFDQQQAVKLALANLGQQSLGTAQGIMGTPFSFSGPALQTSLGTLPTVQGAPNLSDIGKAAASVNAGQLNQGPTAGQYGAAQQGVNAPTLQGQLGSAGQIQGGPNAGLFGLAGSPQGGQGITGAPNLGAYGQAGATSGAGQGIAAAPNVFNFGQAGGNVAAGQGMAQTPNLFGLGTARQGLPSTTGQPKSTFDTAGIAQMPINAGTSAQAAIMNRLQPQLQKSQEQLETQLRNQGLVAGGEAYNDAMTLQNQKANDLLSQAALQGIGLDIAANQQGFGQAQALGQFGNQAQQQAYNQALASGQFANQGLAQNQQTALAQQGAQNAAQQQAFAQQFGVQGLQNQAIQQNAQLALAQQAAANAAQGQGFGQQTTQQGMANQAVAQNQGAALAQQAAANAAQQQGFGQTLQAQQLANQAIGQNFGQGVTAAQLQNQQQQQQFAQNLGAGNFANQAALGQFGMGLQNAGLYNQGLQQNFAQAIAAQQAQNQAQQQGFGQQMDVRSLQNQAIQQNQQAALQQQQAENAAAAQQFNQQLGAGQFGNTAQQQALQQQFGLYNLPLNQISALMSGTQIQNPQFQPYAGANIAPPPIFNAAQQQASWNQNMYNQQVGSQNANMQGLFGLGAAGITAWSDRRLKSNIVRIGTHPLGIGIYEYEIFGHREQGVMADEVLTVMPDAVVMHPSGYQMVDYGRL